jgi:hypothetical protein
MVNRLLKIENLYFYLFSITTQKKSQTISNYQSIKLDNDERSIHAYMQCM